MASVIGYGEECYGKPEVDIYNKIPRFCSRCGKALKPFNVQRYDPYTGEPVYLEFVRCPTLSSIHDFWRREAYGAWVNYGEQ